MRNSFIEGIIKRAEEDKNIVFLTADLGYNCVEKFQEKYPSRFFNVGIAEQNMMAIASGLALEGKKVFVYSIGNFGVLRCLEQIRNDVCYPNLDVNIIANGAGLEYAQMGFSHYLCEDIACLSAMPNLKMFSPASKKEALCSLDYMLSSISPCYIRLNKEEAKFKSEEVNSSFYKVSEGKKCAIFCTGTIIAEALKAKKYNLDMAIYSCPGINSMDKSIQIELAKYKYVFSLEEHSLIGGLSGVLEREIALMLDKKPVFYPFGIENHFCGMIKTREQMKKVHKIDAKSLAKTIKKILKHM